MADSKITSSRITTMAGALALTAAAFCPGQSGAADGSKSDSSTEPVMCMIGLAALGLEVPVGMAVDLCAGSHDGMGTVTCLIQAWGSRDSGGLLGLNLGQAVRLCRVPVGEQ